MTITMAIPLAIAVIFTLALICYCREPVVMTTTDHYYNHYYNVTPCIPYCTTLYYTVLYCTVAVIVTATVTVTVLVPYCMV